MDPQADYRATASTAEEPAEAVENDEEEEKTQPIQKKTKRAKKTEKPEPTPESKPKSEPEPETEPEPEPEPEPKPEDEPEAQKKEKKPKKEIPEEEFESEPFLLAQNGKLRLVLNYQLAVLICFLAAVILICAVLVGWKWGQDSAAKRYLDQLQGNEQVIDHRLPAWELEESATEIKG